MEVAVLAGLVGIGYLFNKDNDDKNPINTEVKKEISTPNGDNVYNSEFYEEADKVVRALAKSNFDSSHEEGSNVINFQKLDRIGSDLNRPLNERTNELEESKEGFTKYVYSSASGSYLSKEDFGTNDQGYGVKPFYKKAPVIEGLNDTRTLNAHQGGAESEFYTSKRETSNFFPLEQQQVFGNTFGEGMGDPARYDTGILRTNQLPFTQERVSHIDVKDGLNRDIGQMIANKANVDNLRAANNPKLTHKGKVLSGKNLTETRGIEGKVNKYDPETFYENTPDKWFVTTGANLEKSQRPEHIIQQTNRSVLNHQPIGNVAPGGQEASEKRSSVRKPLKNQLGTDTIRNASVETPYVSTDLHQKSYRALPNERDVTTLRNHQTNLKTEIGAHTVGLQDGIKKTKKETTLFSNNNGNVQNTVLQHSVGLQDDVKKTKKQTTIDSKNNGYIHGGYNKSPSGFEEPEKTTKDTLNFEYMGGAGGQLKGDMDQQNYMNAETNPTKELISEGREPTLNNVKLANGGDTYNVDIKKLDYDYMNHHSSSISRIYDSPPSNDIRGETTTMKERLEDNSIASRINPDLLDPFKNNPLTQSLESFAY